MANIGWDESQPSDPSSAGLGDDAMRSIKTSVRLGLDTEHVWPSAGGDAGVHRMGSARAYYGPQSAVSSSGTDGRLMVTSDTSRLFHVGSGGTVYLGGPKTISMGTDAGFTFPQRFHWVTEVGVARIDSSSTGSVLITIPNSGYSGLPIIQITENEPSGTGGIPLAPPNVIWAMDITPTQFRAIGYDRTGSFAGAAGSSVNFGWMSIGTRAL